MAQGMATSDGIVTATLSFVPPNAVIAVSRYSGVDTANPIDNIISGNTNGISGDCLGGEDIEYYSFDMYTSFEDAMVYVAAACQKRKHTPGAKFIERAELRQGDDNSVAARIAIEDQKVDLATNVTLNGTYTSTGDWAIIGLAIRPCSGGDIPNISVSPNPYDYGVVVQSLTVTKIFTVTNKGSVNLEVNATELFGDNAYEFSIAGGGVFALLPQETHTIEVSLTPTLEGEKNATLRIVSNDPDEDSLYVDLLAEAVVYEGILGDVNGDLIVSSTDALIILSCDVGIDVSHYCPMNCGDVNGDGNENSTDALIILTHEVQIEVPYPIGQPGCAFGVVPCPGCNP